MCWSKSLSCIMLSLCCSAAFVSSCDRFEGGGAGDGRIMDMVGIELELDGLDNYGDVKSILPEETIESKITDVTLASYDSEGDLLSALYFKDDLSGMSLYLSSKQSNNIYALVNMGDLTGAFPMSEDQVQDIEYRLDSYDEVAVKGIPMCGVMKGCSYVKDKPLTIAVERLFAKLNVRILHTGLSGSSSSTIYAYTLCNKSMYLRQANRRLLPFSDGGSAAMTGVDVMSESDYNPNLADYDAYEGSLGPGSWGPGMGYVQDTTIVLYVPENNQGVLLPGNSDPLSKIADNIADLDGKAYDKLCTYLEFNANKPSRGEGYGGDITYRCYLGEDNVSDFSIRRNTRYDVTMNFTDEGFHLDNWKVYKGEGWLDTRTLCFVDKSYVIYPGTTQNVMVHYNRYDTSLNTDSSGHSGDFGFEYDEESMRKAGLECEFMGNAKLTGSNGCNDHYLKVSASSSAKVGSAFPIKVSMSDGNMSDVAVLYVVEIGELKANWNFCPEYVSQAGELTVAGAVDGLLPLSVEISDPSVCKCEATGDKTFKLTAIGPGKADIVVSNSDGSQTCTTTVNIASPKLQVSDIFVALAPDGEVGKLDYYYLDSEGNPLTNIDYATYASLLMPVVSGSDYISFTPSQSSMDIYISRLYSNRNLINIGAYYNLSVKAKSCPGAGSHSLRAYIIDPFDDISMVYKGRLDDYTLFGFSSVPAVVRDYFADELSSEVNLRFDVPPVDADLAYVTSTFQPVWEADFSYSNGVYCSEYLASDGASSEGASVTLSQNQVYASTYHSAGRHNLDLNVKNRYSGESLSKTIGVFDVYVHTAIGASASFGSLVCSSPSGGVSGAPTVAGIYNSIAGYSYYSTTSSSKIWYMDVKMEYLTDVSKVYVFNRMQGGVSSNTNVLNGLDIVRPSVADGEVNLSNRLLYSVGVGAGQRVGICGEPYGMRKGVGTLLYRALSTYTYSGNLTDSELKYKFLGYDSKQGTALGSYSPCYTLHDMNLGSDMTINKVSKNNPYYFSPVSCSAYRDAYGNGYHVIHTLNAISPDSCGWINLL